MRKPYTEQDYGVIEAWATNHLGVHRQNQIARIQERYPNTLATSADVLYEAVRRGLDELVREMDTEGTE